MCNYTYHHDPTCGHIASFNIDTCTTFTSSLRTAESKSDQKPICCTKTVHSHKIISQTHPSLCLQCEQEWMERAKMRVRAMALGETLLDQYDEEQANLAQLEGLYYPPKCNNDIDAEPDIFIDASVDYFVNGDANSSESDCEGAYECDADEAGESCLTNSPFASQDSSFFEQRQYFHFDIDYENSSISEEYVHVSAVDDESSDDDIELVFLDYPGATPDHGKLLHDLDSSSDSIDRIEFFDINPASSNPEIFPGPRGRREHGIDTRDSAGEGVQRI